MTGPAIVGVFAWAACFFVGVVCGYGTRPKPKQVPARKPVPRQVIYELAPDAEKAVFVVLMDNGDMYTRDEIPSIDGLRHFQWRKVDGPEVRA